MLRELTENDYKEFRRIYLDAVKSRPTLFAESYAETKKSPDVYWQRFLRQAYLDEGSLICGVEDRKTKVLVGMIIIRGNKATRLSHVSHLVPVFFRNSYDDEPVKQESVTKVLDYLKKETEVQKLQTFVTTINPELLSFYNALGFIRYGFDEDHIKVGHSYYDCVLLSKHL